MATARAASVVVSELLEKRNKEKEPLFRAYPKWRREKDIDSMRWGSFEYCCRDGSKLYIEESYSSTGTRVWDTAIAMAKLLEKRDEVKDRKVVELGAGVGLVGMVAARMGAQSVYLTEIPSVLPRLQDAVQKNHLEAICSCRCLDWKESSVERNPFLYDTHFILASDVLICQQWAASFLRMLAAILTHSSSGVQVLVGSPRDRDGVHHFLSLLPAYHLQANELPASDFNPDFYCRSIVVYAISAAADDNYDIK